MAHVYIKKKALSLMIDLEDPSQKHLYINRQTIKEAVGQAAKETFRKGENYAQVIRQSLSFASFDDFERHRKPATGRPLSIKSMLGKPTTHKFSMNYWAS